MCLVSIIRSRAAATLLLLVLAGMVPGCSKDEGVEPEVPPLRLLNCTEPVTVGIGGPLLLRFEVHPSAGIDNVVIDYRSDDGEWHIATFVPAKEGVAPIMHETLGTDRIQLRVSTTNRSIVALSAWISIDRSKVIQPVTIVKPVENARFSYSDRSGNIVEWRLDPLFRAPYLVFSYRRENSSTWLVADTIDCSSTSRWIWSALPMENGTYFVRMQALGYGAATDEVRVEVGDVPELRIVEPSGGRVYYLRELDSLNLRWEYDDPGMMSTFDVEYRYNDANWKKLMTYYGELNSFPLLPELSASGKYNIRIRRNGSLSWAETGEYYLVDFYIGLTGGSATVRRGAPWDLNESSFRSLWHDCHERYVRVYISSDRGSSWERIYPHREIVTALPGSNYMLRAEGDWNSTTLMDTTGVLTVTENISPFMPAFAPGMRFLFREYAWTRVDFYVSYSIDDTLEVEILSTQEDANRYVFNCRKRWLDRADTNWTTFTFTEEKDGLHVIQDFPPRSPMYRYLDNELQSHTFLSRSNCSSDYSYPALITEWSIERGSGLVSSSQDNLNSPRSESRGGVTLIGRW